MTKNEIIAALAEANQKRAEHAHNNGGWGGYNVWEDKIEELAAALVEIEKAELAADWTKEKTITRRAWFNSQKFTCPTVALKACRAEGWEMSDLRKFVRIHAL